MTEATLSYARALRRHAEACARVRAPVVLPLDAVSAAHLAEAIERGCQRSRYVREVQAEAERLRDDAEAQLLRARDVSAAADRSLASAARYRRGWISVSVLALVLAAYGAALWWLA